MNHQYDPYKQAQKARTARRRLTTLLVVQTLGAILGASTVLSLTGTWPFTFDFLVGYMLTAICMVLLLAGALSLRFRSQQSVQQEEEGIVLIRDDLSEFDRLVEQQDQEMALSGEVSPFTQMQLHAYAEGNPVLHVDVHSPELERLTRELLRGTRHEYGPRLPTEDDDDWLWELDDEPEL
jgi:hypothetical protein